MNNEVLCQVASKILGTPVIGATYDTTKLKGGTIGDVRLITGIAKTGNGNELPFKVVLKIQKEFERWGDVDSWRREYDLYASDLDATFANSFTWPKCYHAVLNNDNIHLWLEYADGISGNNLTPQMMEQAALELGRYQGRLYAQNHSCFNGISNLRRVDLRETHYRHWKPKNVEYRYVRSAECEIPTHLTSMIIDIDNHADEIFSRISKLPVVLYHGDYWHENIISSGDKLYIIDWDSAGLGFVGEDIAQLITDETDPALWPEYKAKLIPAYFRGLSENMDVSGLDGTIISDMILTPSYLSVFYYLQTESASEKAYHLKCLQQIYETFFGTTLLTVSKPASTMFPAITNIKEVLL